MTTTFDNLVRSPERMRSYLQERAFENVTALISETMDAAGVTRTALASRLDVTPGWVTQLLDGERNKTLRTLSDVFFALDHKIEFSAKPIAKSEGRMISCLAFRGRAPAQSKNGGDTTGPRTPQPTIIPFVGVA